jgi:hypothetical protein
LTALQGRHSPADGAVSGAGIARHDQNREVLQELVQLGWAAQDGDSFKLTEQGGELRQEAEDATDQLYYGPWDCLDEKEQGELRGLLERLIDELSEEEEE